MHPGLGSYAASNLRQQRADLRHEDVKAAPGGARQPQELGVGDALQKGWSRSVAQRSGGGMLREASSAGAVRSCTAVHLETMTPTIVAASCCMPVLQAASTWQQKQRPLTSGCMCSTWYTIASRKPVRNR